MNLRYAAIRAFRTVSPRWMPDIVRHLEVDVERVVSTVDETHLRRTWRTAARCQPPPARGSRESVCRTAVRDGIWPYAMNAGVAGSD